MAYSPLSPRTTNTVLAPWFWGWDCTGTPRKLGVKGEELPKVMYRLIEADHYVNKQILVVGGGDSAVEAAMGLAYQPGNKVTLSYRQAAFGRIKEAMPSALQNACAKDRSMCCSVQIRWSSRGPRRTGCEWRATGNSQ